MPQLVRIVLLPAAMAVLGERNWYLPRWLAFVRPGGAEGSPAQGASGREAAA
jgi:putative drug exporter of the RND superfamily